MRRSVLVLALALTLAGFYARFASAHLSYGIYTYSSSCNGTGRSDPVNLLFYKDASAGASLNHAIFHLGATSDSGGPMCFWTHSTYYPMDFQRADGPAVDERFRHIRLRETYDGDSNWGITTMGALHRDVLRRCGVFPKHVGIEFDYRRDLAVNLYDNFANHTPVLSANNNNTAVSPQCDGTQSRSADGITKFVKITYNTGH